MIAVMAVGEARPGYELWRPNREKPQSVTMKFVVVLLLVVSAAIAGIVTICGWSLLQGGASMGIICLIFYVVLYLLFAYMVARWQRGVLPVAAAWAVLLVIFCAVGANSWFSRDKVGFDEGSDPGSADRPPGGDPDPAPDRPDGAGDDRLQPGVASRGGATDRLRRGLRGRRTPRRRRAVARLAASHAEWAKTRATGGVPASSALTGSRGPRICPSRGGGGTGLLATLKRSCPQGLVGSNPTRRTDFSIILGWTPPAASR